MGKLEKLFHKLSLPVPQPRIRLKALPDSPMAVSSGTVSVRQAAEALYGITGMGACKAPLAWAKRKKLLPPENSKKVSRQAFCHMLYRFSCCTRSNIGLPGQRLVFDFPDFSGVEDWAREGMQWALSAELLEEEPLLRPEDTVDSDELYSILQRYLEKLSRAREPGRGQAKIQVFGDSISDDKWGDRTTWVSLFPHRLGDAEVTIVNNAYGGGMLTAVPGRKNSVIRLLCSSSMLHPDADLVIIFAGTNDWASDAGAMDSPVNDETYAGALDKMISYIRENSRAKILLITPIGRYNEADRSRPGTDRQGELLNARGYSLADASREILAAARRWDTLGLDLYGFPAFSRENLGFTTIDGLHPNRLGDLLLAIRIYSFLNNEKTL